jgi:hypothetical protein
MPMIDHQLSIPKPANASDFAEAELENRQPTANAIGDDLVVAALVATWSFASAALVERLQDARAVNLPHMAERYHRRQPSGYHGSGRPPA